MVSSESISYNFTQHGSWNRCLPGLVLFSIWANLNWFPLLSSFCFLENFKNIHYILSIFYFHLFSGKIALISFTNVYCQFLLSIKWRNLYVHTLDKAGSTKPERKWTLQLSTYLSSLICCSHLICKKFSLIKKQSNVLCFLITDKLNVYGRMLMGECVLNLTHHYSLVSIFSFTQIEMNKAYNRFQL